MWRSPPTMPQELPMEFAWGTGMSGVATADTLGSMRAADHVE